MKDILADVSDWVEKGEPVAVATVIQTWGSSPRRVGAQMALTPSGKIAGSVSGGCVEGAVFESGVEVLQTGVPQLLHFGVSDETAWEVGLACGGQIDVFVKPLDKALFHARREILLADRPHAVATIIRGPGDQIGREALITGEDGAAGIFDRDIHTEIIEKARAVADFQCFNLTPRH